jgi:hypothetical protein
MPSLKELLNTESLKSGGSYLSELADTIANLPTNLQRVITHPQIFNKIIGYNPMQKETGFAAAATGLPPKQEYPGGILNPPNLEYEKGYESGEPVAIAAGAAPFAIPIGRSAGKALAPKMYQMAEDYMVKTGGLIPATEWKSAPIGRSKASPIDIAQKNAALPESEGGLGLSPNNTAADRAAAQGYIDYYHGTERLDRFLEGKSLNPKRATSGPMPYGTDNPDVASNYAIGKQDTSRIANDVGDMANYFQVSPKDLGYTRGKTPYSVEQTWHHLSSEKKAEILDKARKIGYENPDEGTGKFVVHPTSEGAPFSQSHFEHTLQREAGGNPLKALRQLYAESGMLDAYAPAELSDIYKLAGYPYEISQSNAPWASAKGVMLGKARITNPLITENADELQTKVLPALKEAFAKDRTRIKAGGADQWDKNTRYTPKQWVETLEKDLAEGNNSYVWTSIPDKVTEQLKSLGYNGIIDTGGKGGTVTGHQVVIPFDPSQVRSKFAAFDPKLKDKANMLSGMIPFGLIDTKENEQKSR